MSTKEQLIIDIQELLNSHENISTTTINPDLLVFMDEKTLISIIGSLLDQKETHVENNIQWLEQFKKDKNN
ncbi:MAG TPA: hypothetical protein EYO75_03430 [Sulfurimonas sp.]|nr:hypothetical protein [Sulfurimonas sp.]HIM74627.1 hypothetical protein [Campylobacterales bacterium]